MAKYALFQQFRDDSTFSMLLAPRLMDLELGGAHGGPCVGREWHMSIFLQFYEHF